jgi:hypothetical protein
MNLGMARTALLFALTVLIGHGAAAADVTSYFESSANQKPRGNAGVSLDSDRLQLKANVAASRTSDQVTQVVPRVTSAVTLSNRLGLETQLNLSEWNGRSDLLERKLDTRLHFRPPAPFLDELEGRVWRSPDGRSGRVLKFGFYQILREANVSTPPLAIRSRATVEATTRRTPLAIAAASGAARPDSRRVGIETELTGLASAPGGRRAVRFKVERVDGSRPQSAKSVAYDHAWTVGQLGRVGFNFEMLRATYAPATGFAPSVGLTWRGQF